MFWKKRLLVSEDMAEWIADCFDWFDERYPPPPGPILPTRDFFTAGSGRDLATAEAVLADIKRHLGLEMEIDLVPLDRPESEYRHSYQSMGEVGGTFLRTDTGAVIRYDPEMMQRPLLFIGTMAHEAMHGRLADVVNDVPGGIEAHELATDLGSIIAGYGIFQMQAADDAGWWGYMSQESRAHALALFLKRRGMGMEAVSAHLSPRCANYLRAAIKGLPTP